MGSRLVLAVIYVNLLIYGMARSGFESCQGEILKALLSSHHDWHFTRLWDLFYVLQIIGPQFVGVLLDVAGVRRTALVCFGAVAASQALFALSYSVGLAYLAKVPSLFQHGLLFSQALLAQREDEVDRACALGRAYLLWKLSWSYGLFGMVTGTLRVGSWHQGAFVAAFLSLLNVGLSVLLPAPPPEVAMQEEPLESSAKEDEGNSPAPAVLGRSRRPLAFGAVSRSQAVGLLLPAPVATVLRFRRVGMAKMRAVACHRTISWILLVHALLMFSTQLSFGDEREVMFLLRPGLQFALQTEGHDLFLWMHWCWTAGFPVAVLAMRPLCKRFPIRSLVQVLFVARTCLQFAFAIGFAVAAVAPEPGTARGLLYVVCAPLHCVSYVLLRVFLLVLASSAIAREEYGTLFGFLHAMDFIVLYCMPSMVLPVLVAGGLPGAFGLSAALGACAIAVLRLVVMPRYSSKAS